MVETLLSAAASDAGAPDARRRRAAGGARLCGMVIRQTLDHL
ncbi:hypothetical protein [Frankia sp. CcI49]|nr:hypothetical protein [Frankia sp. CcI49]